MASLDDERLTRIVAKQFRAAGNNADQREREANERARALARAGRQHGKSGRSGGGSKGTSSKSSSSRFRFPSTRVRRAPVSASQYRFERKYSNRAGSHGSPSSAVVKAHYDNDYDTPEDESRVVARVVYAPPGTPTEALDPVKMAVEAERTAGRQINSRQMAHDTTSLPKQLTDVQRERLAFRIAGRTSESMSGVPVYAAVHAPDPGNDNYHAHLSAPLREVISDGEGRFHLGERVAFEQRPQWRRDHGLEPTNHNDLKELRRQIAGECADALREAGVDHHVCERWRYGYLRLNGEGDTQVSQAKARGDVEFVNDNAFRETQRHEGPGHRRSGLPTPTQEHNAGLEVDMAPRILAQRIMADTLREAKDTKAQSWEVVREIAKRRGLTIGYVRRQHKNNTLGAVTGWRCTVAGNTVSGQQAGCTLRAASKDLRENGMLWAGTPPVFTEPSNTRMESDALQRAVESIHKEAGYSGQGGIDAAQPAQRVEAVAVHLQPVAPKVPINEIAPHHQPVKESKMDVSIVMKDLTELPPGHQAQTTLFCGQDIHPMRDSTRAKDRLLNEAERRYMVARHPDQARIRSMGDKLDRLVKEERVHASLEPKSSTWFGSTRRHDAWAKSHAQMTEQIARVKENNEFWLNKHVYADQSLIEEMDAVRAQALTRRPEESTALTEYRKQEKFSKMEGIPGRHARTVMSEIQGRQPDIIKRYKEAEAIRKADEAAAIAEQRRRQEIEDQQGRSGHRGGDSQGKQHVIPDKPKG